MFSMSGRCPTVGLVLSDTLAVITDNAPCRGLAKTAHTPAREKSASPVPVERPASPCDADRCATSSSRPHLISRETAPPLRAGGTRCSLAPKRTYHQLICALVAIIVRGASSKYGPVFSGANWFEAQSRLLKLRTSSCAPSLWRPHRVEGHPRSSDWRGRWVETPWAGPAPAAPLCDSPSVVFTGPWAVTRSSLRMFRWVAAFCRPLRPVLLLVSFPRSWSPVVGVLGLCWMWHGVRFARQRCPVVGILGLCWLLWGSFDCYCCPHTCVLRPSATCLSVFPCA